MRIKRRDFLKAGLAVGVLVALDGPVFNAFAQRARDSGPIPGNWMPTSCQGCTSWCAAEVFVQDGRAVKVRGNQNSKAAHGNVCPRGHLAIQEVYDPDRIKVPMKRTNPRKGRNEDPKFVPITWDEAMNTIADKMIELRKNNEPHKLIVFRGRYTYLHELLYDNVPKIFGSPNNYTHSSLCAEGEKFGYYYTDGLWGYHDYDLQKSRYVIFWGCDPVASNRMVPNAIRRLGEVLDNGTVAVVDPRLSTVASKAHEWMPVLPGQDGALATAMAHVILTEGIWNKEFVGDFKDGKNLFKAGQTVDEAAFAEKHTYGLVKWWNIELKDRTPEWAEKVSGISREQIIRVATGFAKAAPNCVSWLGPGIGMQPRGGYSGMAVSALNGLVGSIDNEGGPIWDTKVPTAKHPSLEAYQDDMSKAGVKQKKLDMRGTKEFPSVAAGKAGSGSIVNVVADSMIKADPYDIKVGIGYWCNFTFSAQGAQRWEEAMSKLPFYVLLGTNPAEMAMFADIVLPASHHMMELPLAYTKSKYNRYSYATIHQQVIKPLWDVKHDESEFVWLLAEKLKDRGFDRLHAYLSTEFKDPETGKTPTNGRELAEITVRIHLAPLWMGKEPLKGDQIKDWADLRSKGMYNSEEYQFRKKWDNFGTVSKKFEFYSETLKKVLTEHAEKHKLSIDDALAAARYTAKGELAFVPHYEPPVFTGDEKAYPFAFIDYKSRLNREGRTANCTWYQEFKAVDPGDDRWDDVIKINPADAQKLGVKDGDSVKVTSTSGSVVTKVKLWEGVRSGTAAKCYGQGHWAYGKVAAKDFSKGIPRGGSSNHVMPAEYERLSGSSTRHAYARVKIEKV